MKRTYNIKKKENKEIIMISKIGSIEEKVRLPPTETISRFYQPQRNRKAIRILTVAVYVLCVSLAAIMLSLYYIFLWDPTIRPFIPKSSNCDKIIIPEQIAIRLLNSTEITAEQFYKNLHKQYDQNINQNPTNIFIRDSRLYKSRHRKPSRVQINLNEYQRRTIFNEIYTKPTTVPSITKAFSKKPLRNIDDEDYTDDASFKESSGYYN